MNSMTQPKRDRFAWLVANALLLATSLILAYGMSGCTTYSHFLHKFGHLAKDSTSVTIQDTVTIPKDSVVLRLKTDTTTTYRIVEQGRARIIYDRTHSITTVKAECKPDTIIKRLQAKCPPIASFGVAPWYKTGFWIAIGVLVVATLVYLFMYHLQLSITKRVSHEPN